jgi:hypothetical protein
VRVFLTAAPPASPQDPQRRNFDVYNDFHRCGIIATRTAFPIIRNARGLELIGFPAVVALLRMWRHIRACRGVQLGRG